MIERIIIVILLVVCFAINVIWAAECKKINDRWRNFCEEMNRITIGLRDARRLLKNIRRRTSEHSYT